MNTLIAMDKYKHFFYKNIDLACFINPDGSFEELNESFTAVLGYTSDELHNKKFFDCIHVDDLAPAFKIIEQVELGIPTMNFVNRFKAKDGEFHYLEWNFVVNRETKKIYAIARDITEKMLADKELVFQNEEKAKCAGELIVANTELQRQNVLKEIRADELLHANMALIIQNTEHEKQTANLLIVNIQLAFEIKEKERRANELVIANEELAFQNEEKEKRAAELRNTRTSLIQTEAHLDKHILGLEKMLVMTSHGVRQPIASILGILHLLDKTITSPGEHKKLMEYIKQSALALDVFTKKLTVFMFNLGKDGVDRVHPLY